MSQLLGGAVTGDIFGLIQNDERENAPWYRLFAELHSDSDRLWPRSRLLGVGSDGVGTWIEGSSWEWPDFSAGSSFGGGNGARARAFTIPDNDESLSANPQSRWMQTYIDAIIDGIYDTGVLFGLHVTAQDVPNMSVRVDVGAVRSFGVQQNVASAASVTIATADPSSPRIDMIVISEDGTLTIRSGVAAVSPKAPEAERGDVTLADVYVPAAATSILQTYIYDKRVLMPQPNAADILAGQPVTEVDDTNITMVLSGQPNVAGLKPFTMTLGWTGTLSLARGGTGGASPFANPSATIGLSVVNGSATTFMRSDAAPPLSQAIVPTWTGLHTFNVGGGSYSIKIGGTTNVWGIAELSGGTAGNLTFDDVTGGARVMLFAQLNSGVMMNGYTATGFNGTPPTNVTRGDVTGTRLSLGNVNAFASNIILWANVASLADFSVVFGDNPYASTAGQSGFAFERFTDGSLYTSFKTIAGGSTMFRTGAGTGTGADRTWMAVTAAAGIVSFPLADIRLTNGTSNVISWGTAGTAVPGASSAGMKLQLFGNAGTVSANDYAIGIEAGAMWFSGSRYNWYDTASVMGMTFIPSSVGALLVRGYISAAVSIATPINTTSGDVSGRRGHFGADEAFRSSETLTNIGGFFKTAFNTGVLPPSDNTNGGMAIGWNFSVGGAEVDYWNVFDGFGGSGHAFLTKTGASTSIYQFKISAVGDILNGGYAQIGSFSAPVDTAAGSITSVKSHVTTGFGGASFGSAVGSGSANMYSLVNSGGYSIIHERTSATAGAFGIGVDAAGQWIFDAVGIVRAWTITVSGGQFAVNIPFATATTASVGTDLTVSGVQGLGAVPVAGINLTLGNLATTFKFLHDVTTFSYTNTFHGLVPCKDAAGVNCYIQVYT